MAKSGPTEKCWVWFRGGLNETGSWKGGWRGGASPLGVIRIEHFNFVACRVPEWRLAWEEPEDLNAPPEIPEGAAWKLWPTEA